MTTDAAPQSGASTAPDSTEAVGGGEAAPKWGALFVVLAGVFITNLDFFIVNVAIPSLQRDLKASPAAIQFIAAGFNIGLAAMLITGGRLGDLYGRRRVFSIGLGVFTAASLACALAPNAGELIAARVVQGISAAVVIPQVLAILSTVYSGKHRATAFNAYGLALGFSAVFGQLIGGLLIKANIAGLDWRAIFLINVPIGVVALVLAPRLVPESKAEVKARLDLVGTVLVTAGLVAIVLPLVEGRQQGWPEWTWVLLAAAVPLLAGFGGYQRRLSRRGGAPLVDLALFKDRAFSVGIATILVFFSAMASFFLVLALFLQQGHHLSALSSGLLFLPLGLGFFGASARAPQLAGKLGRQVLAVGGVVVGAGDLLLIEAANHIGVNGSVEWLIPGLLICGFGMGMVTAPLTALVLAGVAPEHAAAASGVFSTAQEIGNTLGVAIIGAVFFNALGAQAQTGSYPHAFQLSLEILVVSSLVVAGLVQLLPKAPKQG